MSMPSKYTAALANEILSALATGRTLRSICNEMREAGRAKAPTEATVRQYWVVNNVDGFADRYRAARDAGLDCMADELLDISDDSSQDVILNADGDEIANKEYVARSRLRVDTRKWYLAKMAPKRYSERVEQHHTGDPTQPVALTLIGSDIHG